MLYTRIFVPTGVIPRATLQDIDCAAYGDHSLSTLRKLWVFWFRQQLQGDTKDVEGSFCRLQSFAILDFVKHPGSDHPYLCLYRELYGGKPFRTPANSLCLHGCSLLSMMIDSLWDLWSSSSESVLAFSQSSRKNPGGIFF